MDELNGVGKTFEAFTSLSMSPMSITDDHKDNLKRYLIRYMNDSLKRYNMSS